MDPQSVAFQPQTDNSTWRVRDELLRIQAVQAEHSERLTRIERKVEDDARMKSVWGGTSPFPGVLSGTPQQTPLQQPSAEVFKNFDDESTNLIGSLHLDAEDEPRRIGATSRANSVRFDESANQGHWSHATRSSMDLIRSSGGVPMGERSLSHKSEGRASSVHSIRSAASGRMNSLNLDSGGYGFGDSGRPPSEHQGLAPGLLLLGPVPAIIRCWMDTNFKHDALYYAAICSGSHTSLIGRRLVEKLGYTNRITSSQTVVLPVYFPEAIPQPTSSRSSSPAPQLPTLTVKFTVLPVSPTTSTTSSIKSIQIIIGSDTLRLHSADIMFSSNSMSILDDDCSKVSIPLVRPEDQQTFDTLYTAGDHTHLALPKARRRSDAAAQETSISGLGQSKPPSVEGMPAIAAGLAITPTRVPQDLAATCEPSRMAVSCSSDDDLGMNNTRRSIRFAQETDNVAAHPKLDLEGTTDLSTALSAPLVESQSGKASIPSNPLNWNNWRRRDTETTIKPAAMDYASASKGRETMVPRKESGMKVLKPSKSASRSASSASTTISFQTQTPQDGGKSRFFDEGKRRTNADASSPSLQSPMSIPQLDQDGRSPSSQSTIPAAGSGGRAGSVATNPTTSTHPAAAATTAGGTLAFSWLKQAGPK